MKDAIEVSIIFHEGQRMFAVPKQPAPVALTEGVTVPMAVLEAAEASLGSFCSDHGWSNEDMQNMDNLSAYIAIARHKANLGITKGEPAPVQDLPFGVGGGLVAIKTLLSRDPCVHANTAIEMIDAILKEHPAAQPAVPDALNPKDENPAYTAGWNDCRAAMMEMMK
jgi:hypothetical protein